MPYSSNGDQARGTDAGPARRRPRFYPSDSSAPADSDGGRILIEAEASDLSEQQFAASLDSPSALPRRRFVPDLPGSRPQAANHCSDETATAAEMLSRDERAAVQQAEIIAEEPPPMDGAAGFAAEMAQPAADMARPAELCSEPDAYMASDSAVENAGNDAALAGGPQWRQEVAARLHTYHSRRSRKPPRYPSLALKFDPPAYASPAAAEAEPCVPASPAPTRPEVAIAAAPLAQEEIEEVSQVAVDATNVIEFPRPLVPPPPRLDELAEPILDLPRILDAPEAVPKQVPLGGIILQPEEPAAASDLELPLQVAPLTSRLVAAGVDGVLVTAATLMFAAIADKIASLLPSARVLLGLGVALPASLWAVFQYAFLVYTGSTPGMRFAGLHLSDFDGSVPGRSTRRWRALAMALSAVSLGLGFLWCLLDEDTLCWHDRITRTYLAAGSAVSSATRPGPVFPQRVFARLRQVEAFLQRRERETSEEPQDPAQD